MEIVGNYLYINPLKDNVEELKAKKLRELTGNLLVSNDDLSKYKDKCLHYVEFFKDYYLYNLRLSENELSSNAVRFYSSKDGYKDHYYKSFKCYLVFKLSIKGETKTFGESEIIDKIGWLKDIPESANRFLEYVFNVLDNVYYGGYNRMETIGIAENVKIEIDRNDLDKSLFEVYEKEKERAFERDKDKLEKQKSFEGNVFVFKESDDYGYKRYMLTKLLSVKRDSFLEKIIDLRRFEDGKVVMHCYYTEEDYVVGNPIINNWRFDDFFNDTYSKIFNFIERKDASYLTSDYVYENIIKNHNEKLICCLICIIILQQIFLYQF